MASPLGHFKSIVPDVTKISESHEAEHVVWNPNETAEDQPLFCYNTENELRRLYSQFSDSIASYGFAAFERLGGLRFIGPELVRRTWGNPVLAAEDACARAGGQLMEYGDIPTIKHFRAEVRTWKDRIEEDQEALSACRAAHEKCRQEWRVVRDKIGTGDPSTRLRQLRDTMEDLNRTLAEINTVKSELVSALSRFDDTSEAVISSRSEKEDEGGLTGGESQEAKAARAFLIGLQMN